MRSFSLDAHLFRLSLGILCSFLVLSVAHGGVSIVVDSTADTVDGSDGVLTLREAISQAAIELSDVTITFSLGGQAVISPLSPLPGITNNAGVSVTIDGQGNITISGQSAPADTFVGLAITGNNHTITGLTVNKFTRSGTASAGIQISGDGNTVSSCKIGTDADGLFEGFGNRIGLWVTGDSNTIRDCVISGNTLNALVCEDCNGLTLQGNFIGTSPDGDFAIRNGTQIFQNTILFQVSSGTVSNTLIGGAAPGDSSYLPRNHLHGNGRWHAP